MMHCSQFDEDDCIYVASDFPQYPAVVETRHGDVMDTLQEDMTQEMLKAMFKSTLKALIQYSRPEFDVIYKERGEAWDSWCIDLVLFQCYRLRLTDKPISISQFPPVSSHWK
jgi:fructose-1,6-bisphosphatase